MTAGLLSLFVAKLHLDERQSEIVVHALVAERKGILPKLSGLSSCCSDLVQTQNLSVNIICEWPPNRGNIYACLDANQRGREPDRSLPLTHPPLPRYPYSQTSHCIGWRFPGKETIIISDLPHARLCAGMRKDPKTTILDQV